MSRLLLCSLIVAGSLFAAPVAMAQTIRGMSISDHDLPYVKSWCGTLSRRELLRESSTDLEAPLRADGTEDPGSIFSNTPPENLQALATIDLSTIRYIDCQKAGLG